MNNYVVSARKYRPITFNSVVGQGAITQTLKNAVKTGHLAQAFLFCGPRGVGKTTCARILAKTINCEHLTPEFEACDECESCKAFNASASFNISELDAASNNSVEDIRNLVEQVRIPPQIGKYKVYIIDEVHMLSQAAFNAFLKTLEEPPAYAKFILATTEKNKILPTILSRCQIFDFKRITVDDIVNHLSYVAQSEGITAESEALHVIAQKSDGGMRDALSTFDQLVSFSGNNLTYKNVIDNLNVLDYDYFFKLVEYILTNDTTNILLTINQIFNNGFEGHHFVVGMGKHLRSLLVSKNPQTLPLLQESDAIKKRYEQQSNICSQHFLIETLNIFNKCDIDYKMSSNKHLTIEIALLNAAKLAVEEQKKKDDVTEQPIAVQENKENQPQVSAAPPQPKKESTINVSAQNVQQTAQVAKTQLQVTVVQNNTSIPTPPKAPRSSIVRLSNICKKNDEPEVKVETQDIPHNQFTENDVRKVLNEYAATIKDSNMFLFNILDMIKFNLSDNDTIELHFANKVNEDAFNENATEIVTLLRTKLCNGKINVNHVIDEYVVESKPYTDSEKLEVMIRENKNLEYFTKKLNLTPMF